MGNLGRRIAKTASEAVGYFFLFSLATHLVLYITSVPATALLNIQWEFSYEGNHELLSNKFVFHSVDIAMGYGLHCRGSIPGCRKIFVFYSTASKSALAFNEITVGATSTKHSTYNEHVSCLL
jgi:hypothetical protein